MVGGEGSSPRARDSEAELVALLRAGDESAFDRLVRAHYALMLRLVRSYGHSASAAEEIVQETWLGVLRSLDSFEGRSSLKTWIFAILVNQAKKRATRDERHGPPSGELDEETGLERGRFRAADEPFPGHWREYPRDWDLSPERALLGREMLEVVDRAIAALPELQRLVITFRDVEGWDSQEVCETLDITEVNQRVLLHRARTQVRRTLERHFDD